MDERKSEQEQIRREKLAELRKVGFSFPNDFLVNSTCESVRNVALRDDIPTDSGSVENNASTIAGRILAIRLMGKAAFLQVQDRSGPLQVYLRRDEIGEDSFEKFKHFDLGDIVGVSGFPFRTKTGEPSLHAHSVCLLVKCLHPLPEKWHGLTDVEVRYRQRYLDLMVNADVRDCFRKRSQIISQVRSFFNERDYVEVETPVMASIASGASARPFTTHHNTLDMDLHLRIALELPLKRLVVGGIERVYEIGRVFRNEGISTHHNPEFTMLEFYQAYATYEDLMELTEELVVGICDRVIGKREIDFGGKSVSYERPWRRLTMVDALHEIGGVPRECNLLTLEGVQAAARFLEREDLAEIGEYGFALYELFDQCVESKIVNPTFITKFPLDVSPLSRTSVEDSRFVDRFELFVAGMELANAFSELNDPEDQLRRFEQQREEKLKGDEEAMELDEDFICALEYGMPPTAGQGIGIDRLVMLLTGQESIRDVVLFPQMRPLGGV